MLQRLQALEEVQKTSCQMSTASESAVTEVRGSAEHQLSALLQHDPMNDLNIVS